MIKGPPFGTGGASIGDMVAAGIEMARDDRINNVKHAIEGLRPQDFGLRTPEAIDLVVMLMQKHGTNVDESTLRRELDRLMYYHEPMPG